MPSKKPQIDLTEFLSPEDRKKLTKDPQGPLLPQRHIWCTQCGASGERRDYRTFTRPLSFEQEQKLEELGGIDLFRQHVVRDDLIKCEHCDGEGHHYAPDQERAKQLVMFWTHYHCQCGRNFEAPAYANSLLIKTDYYTPIIRSGRIFGWRYNRTVHTPIDDVSCYDRLEHRIEYVHVRVRHCRHCVREHLVICLPHIED